MLFPTLAVHVSTYAELLWHLVNRQNPSETSCPQTPIAVPDKETNSLFALIIGINAYVNPDDARSLDGCVKDATDIRAYLMTNLKVPEFHIRFLTDAQAKRADIISAFLEIQTDSRIKKGDPILIFYAGHGDETDAPAGWPSGDTSNKIQMIIPQDYCRDPAKEVNGIPDHTLAALLNKISSQHGDNITVIMDCCNSGSATRFAGGKVRGIDRDQSQRIPPDLDVLIWSTSGGFHGLNAVPGFTRKELNNHVLLAACTQKEQAADGGPGGGAFTQALLPTLKAIGADKLTYVSLLERMDKIPSQNPQCEGVNQHRIIFNAKAPPTRRVCYPLQMKGATYEMQAGSAHGITLGAEFGLYKDSLTIADSSALCVLVVTSTADIGPFTTTLKIKSLVTNSLPQVLSETSCVLQTKAGEPEDLLLFVPLDERLIKFYEVLATMMKEFQPGQRQIRPVLDRGIARLGLSIVGDQIAFDILDPRLVRLGLTRMPHTVANDPEEIIPILHAAAHFYWHLNREVRDAVVDTSIDIECYSLIYANDSGDEIWEASGDNLLHLGVIDVVSSDQTRLGFRITNKSARDLYMNAFYFDNTDFSIETYYESPKGGKSKGYPPLPKKGGYVTLGYGSGGVPPFRCGLADDADIDVGYLVFLIASENINLSTIPQETPFKLPKWKSVPVTPYSKPIYGTILIPIIQRRIPVNF